jgi:daunorubicin resistance ABC transporter ATP-binding subunit
VSQCTSLRRAPAVEAEDVIKAFGAVTALDRVSLTIAPGTLAALLGPNGAGKTTLVRIVSTLIRPDAGRVRVLGVDVVAEPGRARGLIGLTGQYAGLDEALTGRDNLVLIGRLAGLRRRAAVERAAELADVFGLAPALVRVVRTYSGGMRRRLDLAASLMTRPAVLVLDEPTTGLDPASRSQLWDILTRLRADGTTMLLTTQYLDEADRFADVVHVLDRGKVIATGTVAELKDRVGRPVVEIRLPEPAGTGTAASVLRQRLSLGNEGLRADAGSGLLTVPAVDGAGTLLAAAAALRADRIAVTSIALRQPSLDEAFLALTDNAAPAHDDGHCDDRPMTRRAVNRLRVRPSPGARRGQVHT